MFRLIFLMLGLSILSCKQENKNFQQVASDPAILHQSVKALTDVIVHDIFSPPVASRIYAYASIGAYEAARFSDSSYMSLAGQIKHMPDGPKPESGKVYCFPMVSTLTFLKIGKNLIFSEDSLQVQIQKTMDTYRKTGMPDDVFERSMAFADSMTQYIMKWSSTDNYKQSRSFPKYSLQKDPATWKPTPPGYMDGVEPSWRLIRTIVMDSASQFKPAPPTAYNMTDKNSQYYKEAYQTYEAVKNGADEHKAIANYWDCNPYKLNVTGHVMHATKKISPGGHWVNIAGEASIKSKADFIKSTSVYALLSIGLFESFISCWDEKYRSNAVRPETVINEFIDPEWLPLLQTPPFPEYTSGHSVASAAASYILTNQIGDNFSFVDSTEVEFGLDPRSFTSFKQAADEASISRLYGGIHFMPSIKNGLSQGNNIGEWIIAKLKLKQ
ncbi:MAG: vanadium-dependent haloperoxidase [Saprospiraceae bacterium]|nr:vanadium-dependent haloperoxidase [Saprospiraceae bacterium]